MKTILCAVVALAFAASTVADTIYVPAGGDIQAAINAASDGDVIEIAAGTYDPGATINTAGKAITLRGSVDKNESPTTIISGQGARRVLECTSGEMSDTVLENMLITAGQAFMGGGMYCANSSPTVINCVFLENSVDYGGGVFCNANSNPTLTNCVFERNSAYYGGGMDSYESSPTLTNCVFKDNNAYVGGGMYNSGSSPTLTGCVFENNSADASGGGLSCSSSTSPALANCIFRQNSASSGGGMNSSGSGSLTNCTFQENSASSNGGGMYCSGSPALTNCVFRENSASEFGGGMHLGFSSGRPTLTTTILCGNTPDQAYGSFADNGGNCLASSCTDSNDDGIPDKCDDKNSEVLHVPSGEYPTIASAIAAAGYGDTIEIAAGTYFPDITLNPLGKPITLRGDVDENGFPTTIIDGQDAIYVLECSSGESANTVFENLLITRGHAYAGGGMSCTQSSPTLNNCVFGGNSADYYGGGMYCYYSEPTLDNCMFLENTATGSHASSGGGIYCYSSSPNLSSCMFEDNSATYGGGGMYNASSSSPTLTGCTFEGNSADGSGGGMYNFLDSIPTLTNCTFTENEAADDGGGMYNIQSRSPTLTGCTFTECCQVVPPNSFIDKGGNDYDSWCDDCRTNVDCVGEVDAADLGLILSAWNTTEAQYDIDGDGVVGGGDLGMLLGTWGACP